MENFDKSEIEKFSSLADQWWDPSGKFKPLHLINPLRADYISSKVNLKNKKILDVGCGGGILAESLALKGANVKGIDLADGPLEVAKIREQKRNLGKNLLIKQIKLLEIKHFQVELLVEPFLCYLVKDLVPLLVVALVVLLVV